MLIPLILIGGGGHCKSCIDVIETEGKYNVIGIVDTADKIGTKTLNYNIITDDSGIDELINKGYYFLVALGQIKSVQRRKDIYQNLKNKKANLATIISPFARISQYSTIGEGSIVMHGAQVNADARVGENVILNSGCLIEHEATVGNHVHISTHAVVNGNVEIEDGCFVGSNTVVNHGINISKEIIIGAGSVVINNLTEKGTYVGCPTKRIN